jgi:hypothetical protein
MQRTAEKIKKDRGWSWYGAPLDNGRCPISGGINRTGNKTQISDDQAWEMVGFEYDNIDKVPTKAPGYVRILDSALGSAIGGICEFRDTGAVNHLVIYEAGYLYEVNETTLARTQINADILSPAPAKVFMTPFGAKLIIAHGSTLKSWSGTGDLTDLATSPDGADWVVQHKRRLYCNSTTAGVLRASNAGDETVWSSGYAFSLGRTGEELRNAVSHDDYLLIFQDNAIDAFYPHSIMAASTLQNIANDLGCPSSTGIVSCGDKGIAFYSTEGIKFIAKNSFTPRVISLPVKPILDAIPQDMRSNVSLGWHDGRIRVSCADTANNGGNNIELVCHIGLAEATQSPPPWTGPNNTNASIYYTRLSNNGEKNDLTWADSTDGMLYKRVEGYYASQDSSGTATALTCRITTKYAQLAPLGFISWFKEWYCETEGDGAYTVKGQVDNGNTKALGGDTAEATTGLPLALPFTLTDATLFNRDIKKYWPVSATVPQFGKYIAFIIEETSLKAFKVLKLGILSDNDGRLH